LTAVFLADDPLLAALKQLGLSGIDLEIRSLRSVLAALL